MIFCIIFNALLSSSQSVKYSVSGFSSGAYMSVQIHVANSASVFAAAIVAGGPYYCSLGSKVRSQSACTRNPYLINLSSLTTYANQMSSSNQIDDVTNLSNAQVFILSPQEDFLVFPGVVQQTLNFYKEFVQISNIVSVFNLSGGHVWPTVGYGVPCWSSDLPGIGNCNYDTAGVLLQQFYGKMQKGSFNSSNLFPFDQSTYADVWQAGLSNRGWVYAPYECRVNPAGCKLHVHFHGCNQDYSMIGNVYMTQTGFGEWAEGNNLVILFPQTVPVSMNPGGCWDARGVFGSDFALKSGKHISAVNNMSQNYVRILQTLE